MKIKMLQPARVGNQPTKIGSVYEATDAEGKRLIKEGAAEAFSDAPPVEHAEHHAHKGKTHKMVKDDDAG